MHPPKDSPSPIFFSSLEPRGKIYTCAPKKSGTMYALNTFKRAAFHLLKVPLLRPNNNITLWHNCSFPLQNYLKQTSYVKCLSDRQTDRQIFYWQKESQSRLICHITRDMYMYIQHCIFYQHKARFYNHQLFYLPLLILHPLGTRRYWWINFRKFFFPVINVLFIHLHFV